MTGSGPPHALLMGESEEPQREVDLVAHPEVAIKYGVRSTPAIAIDGTLAWQGIPSAQALRERLEASLRRREET